MIEQPVPRLPAAVPNDWLEYPVLFDPASAQQALRAARTNKRLRLVSLVIHRNRMRSTSSGGTTCSVAVGGRHRTAVTGGVCDLGLRHGGRCSSGRVPGGRRSAFGTDATACSLVANTFLTGGGSEIKPTWRGRRCPCLQGEDGKHVETAGRTRDCRGGHARQRGPGVIGWKSMARLLGS